MLNQKNTLLKIVNLLYFFSVIFSKTKFRDLCGGVISKAGLKRKLAQPSDNVKKIMKNRLGF